MSLMLRQREAKAGRELEEVENEKIEKKWNNDEGDVSVSLHRRHSPLFMLTHNFLCRHA
jgi:hypothetical protein